MKKQEGAVGGANVGVRKRKKERVKRGSKVRKRMRRTGGKEVFKLLIATGRNTTSSKREKQKERATG